MKVLSVVVAILALGGASAIAQESGGQDAKGYASAFGGAAWAAGNSTGSVLFEGGVRVAPHVMAFTNIGRFADLKADLQPTIDAATTALSNQGLAVTGGGTLPAWYGIGGLRAEIPANRHAFPYLLGGIGAAHLNPTPQLTFSSGIMPDGSTPTVGADVTTALVSAGSFTAPPASSAFMVMLGGGVQVPVVPHWVVDLGYRYSHIAADSTLSVASEHERDDVWIRVPLLTGHEGVAALIV